MTASKPLSIVEEQGKKDVLLVFLSILTWRSEERLSHCCFHVDRLRVSPETDIVTSGLVESDLAYPHALSGQYLSPWLKDPFLQVIQAMGSWFVPTYNFGSDQRLFDRFTSVSLSARATLEPLGVSPGDDEPISLDFVRPFVGFTRFSVRELMCEIRLGVERELPGEAMASVWT